jgi:hypothetical protein
VVLAVLPAQADSARATQTLIPEVPPLRKTRPRCAGGSAVGSNCLSMLNVILCSSQYQVRLAISEPPRFWGPYARARMLMSWMTIAGHIRWSHDITGI